MTTVIESAVPLVLPRDDLTIPQFFLDEPAAHFTRPARPAGVPVVVDELSGKALHLHEVRTTAMQRGSDNNHSVLYVGSCGGGVMRWRGPCGAAGIYVSYYLHWLYCNLLTSNSEAGDVGASFLHSGILTGTHWLSSVSLCTQPHWYVWLIAAGLR